MYPHTHICMHTHHVYVHTHTATHACTQNHTHSHTCTHTIMYTYTVTTHTHRHKPKSHTHHACTTTNTGTHMRTACPGFGGPWSPLPVDPGTLGYLKVRGVYVWLITKPSSLGSGPRSPRERHPPLSAALTLLGRRKFSKEVLKAGNGFLGFHTPCAFNLCSCKDAAPISLTLIGWRVRRQLQSRGRGSQGLPSVLGAQEEVGSRGSAPCDF